MAWGVLTAFLALLCALASSSSVPNPSPLTVVFVHTMIPGSCGPLPDHLKVSLLQAQRASNNGTSLRVVILGNFKQCRWALDELKNGGDADLKRIATAESMGIKSSATQEWEKLVRNVVPKGTANEDLLLTSLYRYFMLEDYMTYNNITGHVLHLDADTMLYADPAVFGAALRAGYPRLGLATSIHKRFLSASAMYIGSRSALRKMNQFFASVASNKTGLGAPAVGGSGSGSGGTALSNYASWLRSFACCKPVSQGGLLSHNGVEGVRPWAVSDMTLLAYYRHKNHKEVSLFPLLPKAVLALAAGTNLSSRGAVEAPSVGNGGLNSTYGPGSPGEHHHSSVQAYAESGAEAGPALGGLVDCSGGWGSHLQGGVAAPQPALEQGGSTTVSARATDRHAVVEQAVLRFGCKVEFRCSKAKCMTEPVVACGSGPAAPLLTLHLNPKNRDKAKDFASAPCSC